jgi:hypothetical protein
MVIHSHFTNKVGSEKEGGKRGDGSQSTRAVENEL